MRKAHSSVTSSLLLAVCLASVSTTDPGGPAASRLWDRELARLRPLVSALPTDLDKTTFLREYVGGLIDIGRPDRRAARLYHSVNFESFDPSKFYPLFKSHTLAAECGITTFFYMKLLHIFGFRAYQYSFGYTEERFAQFIHSVTLVEINFRGARRLIIQDPYLDLTYLNSKHEPIDFFDFLAALKHKQYNGIVMDASQVATFLLVPDVALYSPYLSSECRALMRAALRRQDGSLKPRIPFTRSYSQMMTSPCDNFEKGFVEAMREHGVNEPFVYSYTLRASDFVGSADYHELQARIDAALH